MRVYVIVYYAPDDEKEWTAGEAQLALENGTLSVNDLDFLAKDKESGITVKYRVYDEYKGEPR